MTRNSVKSVTFNDRVRRIVAVAALLGAAAAVPAVATAVSSPAKAGHAEAWIVNGGGSHGKEL
jgi:hypothetical protein